MSQAIRANRAQRFLLPPDLDEWVGPDHPVRFVADLVEALDLEKQGFRMSPGKEGRPHFAPELLLGVWLYGWMERIRSTRGLAKALHTHVAFMWLTGQERPDHVTLWRFFDDNKAALQRLFKVVVRAAANAGMVGFALHALDGTRLSAACSTDKAVYRKTLEDELARLDQTVAASMAEMESGEHEAPPEWTMPEAMRNAAERKKKILEALEQLDAASVDHLHPKEPEARMMKTRDGVRLGYNAQIVVDHDSDLIVAADVVTDQTDHRQLVPMIEQVADVWGRPADETVADKGYSAGTQLQEAERLDIPVLVPAQEEASEKGDFAKSKFSFDRERDAYVCPRGEVLPWEATNKASTGKPSLRVYRCGNNACPDRDKCTRDKNGRAIKRYDTEDAMQRQAEKLSLPRNQLLSSLRKEIVEHIFGLVKRVDGFARFTAWGLDSARAQWSLACLAVNLRKLVPHWRAGAPIVAALR